MPIISRDLTLLANREDIGPGVKTWRADGVDGRGQKWCAGPMLGTQAQAEAMRDAAWIAKQLEDHDERLGLEFIDEGGAPESFTREDLTLVQWRRRLARKFWLANIEEDRKFLCKIAPYIATFTAVQIAAVLGITEVKAQKGLDRAIDLRDNVCPAMTDSDAEGEVI